MRDYYGERGCCLTCEAPEEMRGHQSDVWSEEAQKWYDCLCFECKCRKCEWYDDWERRCTRPKMDII